ncbi:venom acid phosphatase Acph-1-like [Diorhabda carinulata]|uniref:venom acid phosphatase Acph-1-like n=1 Tax=Diorhabda carinulata TaxID=1163345 RepID=UPI0025A0F2BF|nr:venom acid phosphatase Acph-1-like [Diorhabda carinulata]
MKFFFETLLLISTRFGFFEAAENTLVAVNLIFRHGDRCPEKSNLYESSIYYNESYFRPYGFGQLTNEGKLRVYNLGKEIREIYTGFLDESYNIDLIEATSSDFNRTKASLQLFLAGLFPPTKELIWLEGFNWQPIAYTYQERNLDEELFGFGCENWNWYLNEYLNTQEGSKIMKKYEDLLKYLTENTGETYDEILKAYYLYFGFEILEDLGYDLPHWSNVIYPNELKNLVMDYYDMITATSNLRRMTGGYLLKHVLDNIQNKIDEKIPTKKMFVWSAHENNIVAILKIMKLWNGNQTIDYCSYVALELHKINNEYTIKIFFKNDATGPKILVIPGCDALCPLTYFKEIVQPDIPRSLSVCRGERSASIRIIPTVTNIIIIYLLSLYFY